MSITRDEIRALCTAHDRMMAENHEWMARREAAAASPVQRSNAEGVLYRMGPENAPAPAPQPARPPSDGDTRLFGDERDEWLRAAMGHVIVEMRKQWRAEIQRRDERISKLETQIEMLVALLGKSDTVSVSKASVVDLPRGFWRRTHDNAA